LGLSGEARRRRGYVKPWQTAYHSRAVETHPQPRSPTDLSGYLEALARVMFQTGISWRVVEAKWPGIREAFGGFKPDQVAALTVADIDRLMDDQRVIRNRKKLEAVVANARRMLDLQAQHTGFDRYLDHLGDFDATSAALRKQFAFLGPAGAWYFLWMVGRPVPPHEQMTGTGRGPRD
jgi:3-methyladenine DNA glycosylase Tag